MNLPAALAAIAALTRETLAQARASGITWSLLAVTAICSIFCLGVSIVGEKPILETRPWEEKHLIPRIETATVKLTEDQIRGEGVDVPEGELRLFFGAVRAPIQRTGADSVRLIQVILAGGVADTAGILLALLWTAGFLPSFLESTQASVLLAKPLPRWCLLAGKSLGVILAVGVQAAIFVAATWLALGIGAGAWDLRYFMAIPILLLHFTVFFAISALLAVRFRSAVASALGAVLIWGACFAVNLARHEAVLAGRDCAALEIAYWILPKPADYNLILAEALQAHEYFRRAVDVPALMSHGAFLPEGTLATALMIPLAALALGHRKLLRTDY